MLESWSNGFRITPSLHHSITPLLHYSLAAALPFRLNLLSPLAFHWLSMLVVAETEQLPVPQARTGNLAAWDTLFRRCQLPWYV